MKTYATSESRLITDNIYRDTIPLEISEDDPVLNMSTEELLVPELELVGHTDTERALWYAKTGEFFARPLATERIDKWKSYDRLSPVGKKMIDHLYGGRKQYSTSDEHYLESYIHSIDNSIDDKKRMLMIATHLGLNIEVGSQSTMGASIVEEMIKLINKYKEDPTIINAINTNDVSPSVYSRIDNYKGNLRF